MKMITTVWEAFAVNLTLRFGVRYYICHRDFRRSMPKLTIGWLKKKCQKPVTSAIEYRVCTLRESSGVNRLVNYVRPPL